MSFAPWSPTAPAGRHETHAGTTELRKEIAREVEKRSKRVGAGDGARGNPVRQRKADTLPSAGHRTLRADVDKLDHMLNLTGEIVIAQGRLRQMIEKLGTEQGRAHPGDASRGRAPVHGSAE